MYTFVHRSAGWTVHMVSMEVSLPQKPVFVFSVFPFLQKEGMQKGNLCTLMQNKTVVDWSGMMHLRRSLKISGWWEVVWIWEMVKEFKHVSRGYMSRMGFPNWLKSKEVKISDEKTSWMIVKEKALREGCHEREWAQMSVPSREKNNTKRNLSKSDH